MKKLSSEADPVKVKKVAVMDAGLMGAGIAQELHFGSMKEVAPGWKLRVLLAQALFSDPDILLLDEPTSALDPISTLVIEELINDLKNKYTVVIVTHNMQQAARVSDQTAFMYMGELIEYADTNSLFTTPSKKKTEDYITGRYG